MTLFEAVKGRCGIPESITVYDDDIKLYISDGISDMRASGVPEYLLGQNKPDPQTSTAITLYVKAYLGDDRTDTDKYLELYRRKVFRLTMEEDDDVE